MSLSVLLFASLLGTWVDRGESRLTTLISTISANRISVIAACICWFFIVGLQDLGSKSNGAEAMESSIEDPQLGPTGFVLGLKNSLFVLVLFLSVIEQLSRTANLFSIERDWVPAMAAPASLSNPDEPPPKFGLAELNAVMSRIDLVCKLISPIAMSAFISVVGSVKIGILAVLILNGSTWTFEIWSARSVYKSSGRLQASKQPSTEGDGPNEIDEASNISIRHFQKLTTNTSGPWWQRSSQRAYEVFQTTRAGITTWLQDYVVNLRIYFDHAVWLPSMALSILHFSVLNYSATLTTYLNQSGFSWDLLTVAKALSAVAEIGSTFFTPWGVRRTGKMWARRDTAMPGSGVASSRDEDSELLLSDQEQDSQEDGEGAFAPQADMGVAILGFCSLIQMVTSLVITPRIISSHSAQLTSPDSRLPRPLGPFLLRPLLPLRKPPPTIHPHNRHPPNHHPLLALRPLDQPPHNATTDPNPRASNSPLGFRRRGNELREFI
jgi:iron-regulated transporter 1